MFQFQRVRGVAAVAVAAIAVAGCNAGATTITPGATSVAQATALPTATATAHATPAANPTAKPTATPVVTPATSPAPGARVVYTVIGNGKQLFSQLADGSDYRQVTTGPGNHVCPAMFPDAQTIAYCADAGGGYAELWTIKPDGSNDSQLTNLGGSALFPAVSPDGTKIAFSGSEGSDPSLEIYAVDAKMGSGLRALTSCAGGKPGCANSYPSWSPDGKRLVYSHQDDGDPEGGFGDNEQIWVMNADGSHAHALTTGPTPKHQRADWSPDGKWIAYASGIPGNEGIWVMRADGSKPTQLTGCKPGDPSTCAMDDWGPTWSPDGSQIAFLRFISETDRPIYIMNADGSGQHRLSPTSIMAGVPTWQ
jgi:Tol biopolymer transport system component